MKKEKRELNKRISLLKRLNWAIKHNDYESCVKLNNALINS